MARTVSARPSSAVRSEQLRTAAGRAEAARRTFNGRAPYVCLCRQHGPDTDADDDDDDNDDRQASVSGALSSAFSAAQRLQRLKGETEVGGLPVNKSVYSGVEVGLLTQRMLCWQRSQAAASGIDRSIGALSLWRG